mmetsp:Transcript_37953/g.108414  ORF Transcript_37953/g.108414 Transcript_37953/m.108414 type:complete len:403 (-) Transcript_37953:1444-2652(-)
MPVVKVDSDGSTTRFQLHSSAFTEEVVRRCIAQAEGILELCVGIVLCGRPGQQLLQRPPNLGIHVFQICKMARLALQLLEQSQRKAYLDAVLVVVHRQTHDDTAYPVHRVRVLRVQRSRVEPCGVGVVVADEHGVGLVEELPDQNLEKLAPHTAFVEAFLALESNAQGKTHASRISFTETSHRVLHDVLAPHRELEEMPRVVACQERQDLRGAQEPLLQGVLLDRVGHLQHLLLEGHRHKVPVDHEHTRPRRQRLRRVLKTPLLREEQLNRLRQGCCAPAPALCVLHQLLVCDARGYGFLIECGDLKLARPQEAVAQDGLGAAVHQQHLPLLIPQLLVRHEEHLHQHHSVPELEVGHALRGMAYLDALVQELTHRGHHGLPQDGCLRKLVHEEAQHLCTFCG